MSRINNGSDIDHILSIPTKQHSLEYLQFGRIFPGDCEHSGKTADFSTVTQKTQQIATFVNTIL